MSVVFHKENIDFTIKNKAAARAWAKALVGTYHKKLGELNYIFCNDEYLLKINQEHLSHDTFTDIITFDNGDSAKNLIEGDIFISIERVRENAAIHITTFEEELTRVMSHGILHLIGFEDKKKADIAKMRMAEQEAIALYYKLANVPRGTFAG